MTWISVSLKKTDDFDSLMWDFIFKGHILTLHYNIYTGISIYPRKSGKHREKIMMQ